MFGNLLEQDNKTAAKAKEAAKPKKVEKNADLEDGEIASDREERRARDPYRDDRRDYRRDDRREERQEPKRPNYYESGDRLNFYRHRREGDRGPVRSSWQGRSPPARNSPY